MTVNVNCKCGARFAAPSNMRGHTIACIVCRNALRVPSAEAAALERSAASRQTDLDWSDGSGSGETSGYQADEANEELTSRRRPQTPSSAGAARVAGGANQRAEDEDDEVLWFDAPGGKPAEQAAEEVRSDRSRPESPAPMTSQGVEDDSEENNASGASRLVQPESLEEQERRKRRRVVDLYKHRQTPTKAEPQEIAKEEGESGNSEQTADLYRIASRLNAAPPQPRASHHPYQRMELDESVVVTTDGVIMHADNSEDPEQRMDLMEFVHGQCRILGQSFDLGEPQELLVAGKSARASFQCGSETRGFALKHDALADWGQLSDALHRLRGDDQGMESDGRDTLIPTRYAMRSSAREMLNQRPYAPPKSG